MAKRTLGTVMLMGEVQLENGVELGCERPEVLCPGV